MPGETVILYEMYYLHRQIFTDGRGLPREYLSPSWMGYSVGHWEGDDFVVETSGINEKVFIDTNGHPHTDALRVIERFHRKDFGHMEVNITIDDTKAYQALVFDHQAASAGGYRTAGVRVRKERRSGALRRK